MHFNASYMLLVIPSRYMMFMQRRINVDATSWRCIDVDTTLPRRHMHAGYEMQFGLVNQPSTSYISCFQDQVDFW